MAHLLQAFNNQVNMTVALNWNKDTVNLTFAYFERYLTENFQIIQQFDDFCTNPVLYGVIHDANTLRSLKDVVDRIKEFCKDGSCYFYRGDRRLLQVSYQGYPFKLDSLLDSSSLSRELHPP
ncbi:uncharacterized protein FIBRA_00818 [Fibroporia radiculosa]|uniref:Uncharacterized protein n=1 Tax=Fibroporia radiculosa TaxID=599839 RepID=J4G0M3_9APHY|nr:uncharacterized protein FIBRA_00818 [Fibroporia radiculosa]CCL98813.1 predicted protein [Fibroporia radiculosa]